MHDTDDFWFHLYKPKFGDTIFDIGAGIGEDMRAFSNAVGCAGTVVAIEPHPESHRQLLKLRHEQKCSNTIILNYALTRDVGPAYLEDLEYITNRTHNEPGQGRIPVWGESLFDIVSNLKVGVIDLLKINIEGGEVLALAGGVRVLPQVRYMRRLHAMTSARWTGRRWRVATS